MQPYHYCLFLACLLAACNPSQPDSERPLRVAVAANFATTAAQLAQAFERQHPKCRVELTKGSSGKLYTQIIHGAPFDVFLSADLERPQRLASEGLAAKHSVFRYARGRLVLFGPALGRKADGRSVLVGRGFEHLAIANPNSAPYGVAARQSLERMQLWQPLQPKLVRGENVAQVYQFVVSGNAELGLLPRPMARDSAYPSWLVPSELHAPIWQAGVVVERKHRHPLAQAFANFVQSESSRQLIQKAGYEWGS